MLEIKGSGGSATLEATSTSSVGSAGICVSSENGSASLNISGGTDVTARNTAHYWGGYGVYLNSWGDNPIPPTNLTVDGGSLTASGATNGIYSQYNGGNSSDNGTLNLTVSNNAVVRAENGIGKNGNNSSVNYQTDGANGGIVFDGGNGTVYGNVTLQDDLTIGEGESLTVPEGSRLNTNGKLTVNGGTLTGIERITGTVKYAPTITTTSLTEGTVGTAYSQILAAMGDMPITWSVSGGSLPGGLSLSSDGKITGTPTDAGEFSFTVTADNNSGSDSKEFSLSVGQATPQATDFTFTAPTDLVYDGNAKYATVTAKEGIVGMGEITVIEYYDEDGNLLTDAPVNAGVYTVKIDAAKGDNYTAVTDLTDNTWKFTIEQSGTVFENDEITTNKSSYTYGDTMTVTVKPVPTGVEASRMLSFDAPTTNQMAIFFDDKQVSDGADAETDGTYTMTVYTTDIGAGTKELTAKYVGNSNMADYEKKFNVHINKATPQISDFTFTAPTDLVYDGNGKTATVTANAGIGTVTVVYYKADGTRLNIAPVDAGAYTVKIDAAKGDNYTAVTDLTDNTWTFEIKQATPVLAENSTMEAERVRRGQKLSTSEINGVVNNLKGESLEGTWTWKNDREMEKTGTFTETAVFTPTDANYAPIEETVSVTVYRTSSGGGGNSTAYYTVTFDTQGGSETDSKRVARNKSVTEPEEPTKDNCTFEGWFTDKDCTEAYDFDTKITKSMTLYAKWAEETTEPTDPTEWENPFDDVDKKDWFYESVKYTEENGLFDGIDATTFEPNRAITRGMLITVLWRAENQPVVDYLMTFGDVDENAYYAEAIRWAASEQLVKGYSETKFAPDQLITREEMAAIINRYADYKDMESMQAGDLSQFNDTARISPWATENVRWAVGNGILSGKSNGILDPQGNTTRAEIAVILQRLLEK